jgi:type I restriction enzyme R subunit
MKFNEDSRVKIPTVIHLCKLGYAYISKKNQNIDTQTNIFKNIFFDSLKRNNLNLSSVDIIKIYEQIKLSLSNEDLGKEFYDKYLKNSQIKLIDFNNFNNNVFNVVTELPYRNDEEIFRPDITLLVNGLPLAFIEVKKPNNPDGIQAEHLRIEKRFKNKKFKEFINLTQITVFSNNMEYDDSSHLPLQGAFYASTSTNKLQLNYFREDKEKKNELLKSINNVSENEENFILNDNNLLSIKNSKEFIENNKIDTPTNNICTSLFSKKRFLFFLNYGIVYVNEINEIKKNILRYPQYFALKKIEDSLNQNKKKGVIWHTQGSGKTALSYFATKYLLDYFDSKGVVSKYYFIVDRITLLEQATDEFLKRGLAVHIIDSKEEFSKDIKSPEAIHNDKGLKEITVVNIQKFKDDPEISSTNDYNLKIQRVYFLDEVHRSYNPKGSFLANLHQSDPNAIKIGLTGTPLLSDSNSTRSVFGDYIHKYFYNESISDGYTLRLMREEIENQRKKQLDEILNEIKVKKGSINKEKVYSDERFVGPMLDYIVKDFERTKIVLNDNSIGGMIVCDSYEQAKEMFQIFNNKYKKDSDATDDKKVNSAALILFDEGTKKDRRKNIDDFKNGKIDFLFVFNMLLTGFDSPRLKKIYLGRKIKSHNLLQALTRVNRPYKNLRYGYVVDFANIEEEFNKTNKAYFDELELELGNEIQNYEKMFKSEEEIKIEINELSNFLFKFDTTNIENFQKQISEINEREEILELVKQLQNSKELYNIIRLTGNYKLLDKLDYKNLKRLYNEANNRLMLINTKISLENDYDISGLLNIALEDLVVSFRKIKEEELVITDKYRNLLKMTRESLGQNFDPVDIIFINLKKELERVFKIKNLIDVSKSTIEENIPILEKLLKGSQKLNRENELLIAKYNHDSKYARIHKRLIVTENYKNNELKLFETLIGLKKVTDENISKNFSLLENESYSEKMFSRLIINEFNNNNMPIENDYVKSLNKLIFNEYVNEFKGYNAP